MPPHLTALVTNDPLLPPVALADAESSPAVVVSTPGKAGHRPPKAVLTRRARAESGARRTGNRCQASVPCPLELVKRALCPLCGPPARAGLPKRSQAPKRATAAKHSVTALIHIRPDPPADHIRPIQPGLRMSLAEQPMAVVQTNPYAASREQESKPIEGLCEVTRYAEQDDLYAYVRPRPAVPLRA